MLKNKNRTLELFKNAFGAIPSSELNGLIYKFSYIFYLMKKNSNNYNKTIENNETRERELALKQFIEIVESDEQLFHFNFEHNDLLVKVLSSLKSYDYPINLKQIFDDFNSKSIEELKEIVSYDYESTIYNMSTPKSIIDLALRILETNKENDICDVGSYTGNFLLEYAKHKPSYNYHGIEINEDFALISKIRLLLFTDNVKIEIRNIFELEDTNRKYNKVFSNFPSGLRLSTHDYFIINRKNNKINFDFSSKITTDWVFVSQIINLLSNGGKGVVTVMNGSLFKMTDVDFRKRLVDLGYVEAVIALPERVFGYTGRPYSILVLSNNNKKVKFINANELSKNNSRVKELDVDSIFAEYVTNEMLNEKSKLTKIVNNEIIREKDYNLFPLSYTEDDIKLVNPVKLESVILDIFRGYQIKGSEMDSYAVPIGTKDSYKVLMLQNIEDGIIDYSQLPTIKPEDNRMDRYLLKNGDIVISSRGEKIKTAIVELNNEEKIIANGSIVVIRCDESKINPTYLKIFFDSEKGNKLLSLIQTGSTRLLSLNPNALRNMDISLIKREKQDYLARKYLAKLDSINITKQRLKRLEEELKNISLEEYR